MTASLSLTSHVLDVFLKVIFRHVFVRITPLFNILTEFGIFTKHTTDEIFETSAAALGFPAYFKTEFCCFEMGSFFSYNLLYIKLEC